MSMTPSLIGDEMNVMLSNKLRYEEDEQSSKNLLESEEDVTEEEGEMELKKS
jgi:hypothetical protein